MSTPDRERAAVAPQAVATSVLQADPLAWARRLQRRHQQGARLTETQVGMYHRALGLPLPERGRAGR